ncbi:hypothetical protein [Actinomadura sp. CNU-125]|uniref:hypothetical protein n=1 Tax=Actinomadura sp. CNU-125 TaxID=1904961 RepID=UPI001177FC41|nr:hypothetical protein [Actinomadura sp. CNU-125]
MSRIIKQASKLTSTGYHMFGFHDASHSQPDVVPPASTWIGHGPHEVTIRVIEELPDKTLEFELWDGPPAKPADAEVSETFGLDLPTGSISVYAIAAGHVHDVFEVPHGRYQVRVSGWNRESTAREISSVGQRTGFNDADPDFADAMRRLEGHERYLAQFWRA